MRLESDARVTPDHEPPDAEMRLLRESLAALARVESGAGAPPHVERAVLNAWDQSHARRTPAWMRTARWAGAGALAAGIALVAGITLDRRAPNIPAPALPAAGSPLAAADPPTGPDPRGPADPQDTASASQPAGLSRPATTVVLVGSPIAAGEPVQIVRMRIARDTLLSMGLRPVAMSDADRIDVEMLVGEDGVARGLRVGR
jgi:hypothetical protein